MTSTAYNFDWIINVESILDDESGEPALDEFDPEHDGSPLMERLIDSLESDGDDGVCYKAQLAVVSQIQNLLTQTIQGQVESILARRVFRVLHYAGHAKNAERKHELDENKVFFFGRHLLENDLPRGLDGNRGHYFSSNQQGTFGDFESLWQVSSLPH
jgi:hypothetical protein